MALISPVMFGGLKPFNFSQSSAFNKVDKRTSAVSPSLTPPSVSNVVTRLSHFHPLPGILPGLPALTSYHSGLWSTPMVCLGQAFSRNTQEFGNHEEIDSPKHKEDGSSEKMISVDTDVYLHVDTSIPFANYFLNLKKILHKEKPSEESDTEQSDSDILKSPKFEQNDLNASRESDCESRSSLTSHSDIIQTSNIILHRTTENHDSISTFQQPMPSTSAEFGHSQSTPVMPTDFSLFPVNPYVSPPSSSLDKHPERMSGGIRIFNSRNMTAQHSSSRNSGAEKPAAPKKYNCDVCGKSFSRSNTLVTHKVCLCLKGKLLCTKTTANKQTSKKRQNNVCYL